MLCLTGDEPVGLFFTEDRAGIRRVVAALERQAHPLLRESEDIGAVPLIVAEPTREQVSSLFAMA